MVTLSCHCTQQTPRTTISHSHKKLLCLANMLNLESSSKRYRNHLHMVTEADDESALLGAASEQPKRIGQG
jgi:hypothetical protein